MPNKQGAIAHGKFLWLGINTRRGTFSSARNTLTIANDGIVDDMYRSMWRKISGHDVDYIATDGVATGDPVVNLRQITIVDASEIRAAGTEAGVTIDYGMLRENMVIALETNFQDVKFSKLRPLTRIVIGDTHPTVLILTEENGPCKTITRPIAVHQKDITLDERIRNALKDRRGQMAMVRSGNESDIHVGDTFRIFPPMSS